MSILLYEKKDHIAYITLNRPTAQYHERGTQPAVDQSPA